MNVEFFLDTNVLIYAFTDQDAAKKSRSRELYELALAGKGIISYQVVQEFLNAAQRKFPSRFNESDLREFLDKTLWPICTVFPTRELYQQAITLQRESGWSFYDSLIVAAALAGDCPILYSEDLQSGRKIHGLEVRSPFAYTA
jgi:predicted nucleic acid-binding protein